MAASSASQYPVPPLVGTLPPECQRDLTALRRVVRTALEDASPLDAVSPADFRHVLVTGATGFVGRFLVRDLLAHRSELTVHCVVRAESAERGFERLRANMQHAETWDDAFASRIHVYAGDVSQPRFGLPEADFGRLCREIDAVYHLAADPNLVASYRSLRQVNALGVREVLRLCLSVRLRHLFHVSTMGVFPEYVHSFAGEYRDCHIGDHAQPDLGRMKRVMPLGLLGYAWSKLVAEQAVLFAHQVGLPAAVFRFGQTTMASTGYAQSDTPPQLVFAAAVQVGMIPQGFTMRATDDPVDTLTRMCTDISMNVNRRFTVYNCCNNEPSYRAMQLAEFGLDYPEVPYTVFKRACQAHGDESPMARSWPLFDHFAPYWFRGSETVQTLPVSDRAIREDCPGDINWPGPLTRYVRYNRWVRDREEEWPQAIPQLGVSLDSVLKQARRYARDNGVPFATTYPEWMLEGLARLVEGFNAPEAGLLAKRIGHCVFDLCRILRNNAELAGERTRLPEIGRQPIERPVFIVGINRTGTTFLHRLLARDRRFWALRAYEYVEPVIPDGDYATVVGTPRDPRRIKAADVFAAGRIVDTLAGLHHAGLDEPEEDIPILRLSLKTWVFATRYRLPEYERWLEESGTREAYHVHRRTMQHYNYQRRACHPGRQCQWIFKMPTHLMELGALLEAYPDALFIQTHRDPAQVMGSWNSLVERIRSATIEPRSSVQTGEEQLTFMSGMLNRGVQFRMAWPEIEDRWVDVDYADLVSDPVSAVRGIYERFDWMLDRDAEDEMNAWLVRQAERRRRETRHSYHLEDYGLDRQKVRAAFSAYLDFMGA